MPIRAKKYLGQHFLKDENIAQKIVNYLGLHKNYRYVLEIGGGMGILTKYLFNNPNFETFVIEIDPVFYNLLQNKFPEKKEYILHGDFLKINLSRLFNENLAIIGNFPYNISSQILFKVLQYRNQVTELVGMFQKEVAERITAKPNSKIYGTLSVLIQAYYNIEYLFTVDESVFSPRPKVKSAVIRLIRNNIELLPCNENLFFKIVKKGFNYRRKMLKNALKEIIQNKKIEHTFLTRRAENLGIDDYIKLTLLIEKSIFSS